jgi:hypothetical protein
MYEMEGPRPVPSPWQADCSAASCGETCAAPRSSSGCPVAVYGVTRPAALAADCSATVRCETLLGSGSLESVAPVIRLSRRSQGHP